MPVVNVTNKGVNLNAGSVQGLIHAYCRDRGLATFGITIVNPPPPYTNHLFSAVNMATFQVDGYAVWV